MMEETIAELRQLLKERHAQRARLDMLLDRLNDAVTNLTEALTGERLTPRKTQ